ncbi:MAG TPA: VWA domain-containing protein, partial [Candidatus Binatia bacterium]|nr:VWA domain-containing protein [Candidatus Binatia bacterium]
HYLQTRVRPASPLVYLPRFLELIALALLVIALLDPVLPAAHRFVAKKGLDIIMVVDLSSSMQEPIDLRGAMERQRAGIRVKEKDRLAAVKDAMVDFVQRRRDDRLAVVVFSENAYVVAPMTFDSAYVQRYLQMVDNKTLANEGQTAIGEGIITALDLAAKQGRDPRGGEKGRVMIVLTDGENNTGRDVYQAIARAKEEKFKIHFIGVEVEKVRDAPRLMAAVEATGGNYFDVRDAKQLEEAYANINRTEKGTFLVKSLGSRVPWFYPFALASLCVLALSMALRAIPFFVEVT